MVASIVLLIIGEVYLLAFLEVDLSQGFLHSENANLFHPAAPPHCLLHPQQDGLCCEELVVVEEEYLAGDQLFVVCVSPRQHFYQFLIDQSSPV